MDTLLRTQLETGSNDILGSRFSPVRSSTYREKEKDDQCVPDPYRASQTDNVPKILNLRAALAHD
jgi:hypothetical protein